MLLNILLIILLADFIAGVGHWAENTYCYKDILPRWLDKSICEPNLMHHVNQADCLQFNFLETVKISTLLSLVPGLICIACGLYVLGIAILVAPLSAQTHIWTHKKSNIFIVRLLQDMSILQTAQHHAVHHKFPHTCRYCTLTNWLNPILDLGFWRLLEATLAALFGLKVKQVRVKNIEKDKDSKKFKIDPSRLTP
jgi:hypothetical protein